MRRREFITLFGGAAAAWPLAGRAQQTPRARTIGLLLPGVSRTTVVQAQLEAFRQALKEYGWIEGQNISVEYRFAEGKKDALAEIAAELVRLRLDIIRRHSGNPGGENCYADYPNRHGTDPVGNGLVASLHRPGGNVPGQASTRLNWPASVFNS